jgi:pseudaminic acid cytidylyltransferase
MPNSPVAAHAIAVIPARGGSKRIPRKNILPFAGQPMIHWPIRAALDSGLFAAIVVSTDDPEIAAVAVAAGAICPVLRPAALSDDHTPLRPVIQHAVHAYEADAGVQVAQVCSILATAALLRPADLRAGHAALAAPGVRFVLAAARFAAPIQRAFMLTENGGLVMMHPEHRLTRSQDLPECFFDAGQFYWGWREAFLSDAPMYGDATRPVILPRDRAIDIDTPDDWAAAERAFAAHHQSTEPPR